MNKFFRSFADQFRSLKKPARLFLLAIFFDGLLFSGYNLFFNLYIIEAGFSRDFLGLINAAPSMAGLVLAVPLGALSDRMGRKRAMIIGFSVANFAIIAMLLLHNEPLMILMGLIWGTFGYLYGLSHAPFMMKVSDDRSRDVLFSFSMGMFPLASTLGSFLAGYMPDFFRNLFGITSSATAYQAVLLFSVIGSFLVLVPIAFIREQKKGVADEVGNEELQKKPVWKVIFRPLTLKLALPNLLIGFGAATLVPYFNIYFAERYRMGDAALGVLFSAGSLVIGVGCLIAPRLVGNLGGKVRAVVLGQMASLGFLLLIGFSPWAWMAVIGFLARGALMNMTSPLFDAFALEQTDENEHGTVNSLRSLAWSVGWAVGPYLSGLVQERWGFAPLFVSTAVLYGLASALTWAFFKPRTAGTVLQPRPAE